MKIFWLIIALIISMYMMKTKENFTLEDGYKKFKENHCKHTTKELDRINQHIDTFCNKKYTDERLHDRNNDKQTCRLFESMKLELEPNRDSFCEGIKLESAQTDTNDDMKITKRHQTTKTKPKPQNNTPLETSKFPFKNEIVAKDELDNKNSEKKN